MSEPEDYVICRICDKRLQSISSFHLKIHNISVSEYKRRYLDAPLISKCALRRRINRMVQTQTRRSGFRNFMTGLEQFLLPLCGCGCGGQVKRSTARFLRGHHMRIPEQKERISEYRSRPEVKKKYSEERRGEKNPVYKPENHIIIVKPCEICGKDIETYQHKPKRFCSEECLRVFFSQRMLGDKNPMKIPEVAKRSTENTDYVAAGRTQSKTIARKKTEGIYEPSMNMIKRTDPERYEELCRMRSEQMLGDNNPMKDPIVVEKVRLKLIGRTFSHSEETITKLRIIKQANPTRLFGPDNGSWKGGISFLHYGPEFNRALKEQIRTRDNCTCQLCGITQEELGRTLSVHHIDYDKKHNLPLNLIALCLKCNGAVNFDREYWTEFFKGMMIAREDVITVRRRMICK